MTNKFFACLLTSCFLFPVLWAQSQERIINRNIQYFFSDYFGKLDTAFTSTKNSSTCFFLDSGMSMLIDEQKLPKYKSWVGSRLFNDSWFKMSGKNYELSLDPYFDLSLGHETTIGQQIWSNKRGFYFNGRFGSKIKVHSYLQEGPIKPEPFINDYILNNGTRPGEGPAKFEGPEVIGKYLSFGGIEYKASKFVDLTFAHGKNFLGDGYRSLVLSDIGANYLFGRIDFHLGKKVNYTAIVAEFVDEVPTGARVRRKKYGSYHYLDVALSKNFHLSVYEAVIWGGDSASRNTLEFNYLNPFAVMRPLEFDLGSPDNVLIGTGFKYTPTKSVTLYSQLLLTEFKYSEFFGGNDWWANKYALQGGAKFHNFKFAKNLFFQLEYNHIRPFTYNHWSSLTSFSNARQPLAHPGGSNLQEAILIANYRFKRWNMNFKSIYKKSGLENSDSTSVGSDVLRSYYDRESEYGNVIGQGIPYQQFHNTLSISYLINPSNMMFLEAGVVNRHQIIDGDALQQNYFFFGLKTTISNIYYDF